MDILRKYFYGQLSAVEEFKVQEWLTEHGDDPQVVAALETLMSEQEREDRALSSPAFISVKNRLGIRKRTVRKVMRKVSLWAACTAVFILLPVLGAIAYSYMEPETQWMEMKVPHGQIAQILLPDGTVLHLNADSRVIYPSRFDGKERRVFVDGEIFAEVVKNPDIPFVVCAGDVDVQVFGTTFNLKAYDSSESVELFLLEGSVRMDVEREQRSRQIMLEPGDVVQYDRTSGEVAMRKCNPFQYRGFHEDGAIHFFNLRLSDIASDLERYFDTKVVILDESLAESRYFALFTNNETLDQILDGINVDGKMKFIKKDGVIYIARK